MSDIMSALLGLASKIWPSVGGRCYMRGLGAGGWGFQPRMVGREVLAERGLKRRRAGLAGLPFLKLGTGVVVAVARAGDAEFWSESPKRGVGRNRACDPVRVPPRPMSVAEIKAQADVLAFEDIGVLARYFRALALRKDPQRRAQLQAAQQSADSLTQAELERDLDQRDQAGR